jgi:hypothetical protein
MSFCADCRNPLGCMQGFGCLKDYVESSPQSWEDLCKRQALNALSSGFGFDTAMHLPCPGCGAKDFMVYRIIESEQAMERGAVCKECERGFRMPVSRSGNSISFTFVQSSGPDLPAWFKLPIKREGGRH